MIQLYIHGEYNFVNVTEFTVTWGPDDKLGCRNSCKIPVGDFCSQGRVLCCLISIQPSLWFFILWSMEKYLTVWKNIRFFISGKTCLGGGTESQSWRYFASTYFAVSYRNCCPLFFFFYLFFYLYDTSKGYLNIHQRDIWIGVGQQCTLLRQSIALSYLNRVSMRLNVQENVSGHREILLFFVSEFSLRPRSIIRNEIFFFP